MSASHRLLPIDAVRGTAMFFVGISHISFFLLNSAPLTSLLLRAFGMFATPNFLLMSGLACGYQLARSPDRGTAIRILDRGLFVLLIGHIVIAGSLVYIVLPATALEHIVITDTIGLMLCTAPLLADFRARHLLTAGIVIFLVSSSIGLTWRPSSVMGAAVGGALLGIDVKILPDAGWIAATLPLLGLFLVGVGLGKVIDDFRGAGQHALWTRLLRVGCVAAAAGLALNLGQHFLKLILAARSAGLDWTHPALAALDIRQKMPPSPVYALFFAGAGIGLVGLIGLYSVRLQPAVGQRLIRIAALVGRASFISYVSQQWLIEFMPYRLGFAARLQSPWAALLYLLLATLVMLSIAWVWDSFAANRYLTVGLKTLCRVSVPRAGMAAGGSA